MRAIGWERAVIGTVLQDPSLLPSELRPSDFTGGHQIIWTEMLDLANRDALDLRTLIEVLRSRGDLDRIGYSDVEMDGEDYLQSLLSYRGQSIDEYIDRVLSASGKRQLHQIGALIAADALDENIHFEEAFDQAERRLVSMRRNQTTGSTIQEVLNVFIHKTEGLRDGTYEPAWVPPLPQLKQIVDYVDEDDFILIAGRPGTGKTSLQRYLMGQSAIEGKGALIFNLENGEVEYAKFLISMVTGIDSAKLKNPRLLTPEELENVKTAAQALARIPLRIVTLASPSINEIDRIARSYINKENISLIGIDYLQLVKNGISNQQEDISATTSGSRAIAMRYKIPVIGNAQLSREIIHRGENAEPQLSDLRGSGSLENDGTMVWFPWAIWSNPTSTQLSRFRENLDPNGRLYQTIKAQPIKIKVAKNRNGPIGVTAPVLWVMSTNNYTGINLEGN